MAGRGVDRLGVPRRRAIAAAIIRRAKMRSALNHLARDLDLGLARIVAVFRTRTARIDRHAARLLLRVRRGMPIGDPFPGIADHVVEPVAVGREGSHRRCALVVPSENYIRA